MPGRWNHFWARTLREIAATAARTAARLDPEPLPGDTEAGVPADWLARVRGANAAWVGLKPGQLARPEVGPSKPEHRAAALPFAAPASPPFSQAVSPVRTPGPVSASIPSPAGRPALRFSAASSGGRAGTVQVISGEENRPPQNSGPRLPSAAWPESAHRRPQVRLAARTAGSAAGAPPAPLTFPAGQTRSEAGPVPFPEVPKRPEAPWTRFATAPERPQSGQPTWPRGTSAVSEERPAGPIAAETVAEAERVWPSSRPGRVAQAAEPWADIAARPEQAWADGQAPLTDLSWPDLPSLPAGPEAEDAWLDAAAQHQRQRADLLDLRREQRGEGWNG